MLALVALHVAACYQNPDCLLNLELSVRLLLWPGHITAWLPCVLRHPCPAPCRPQVQLALLAAAAKMFFKRPPEAQQVLGAAIAGGLAESNQDVHDRALLYYR